MKSLGSLLLSLVLVVMLATPAHAGGVEVDCDDDPGGLAAAVVAAAAGATLEIEGRCLGTITIDKDLTIEGDDDAVLDGDGAGPVVTVEADVTVVLENLRITGGTASGPHAIGGIHNNGDLTLRQVGVVNNHADATGTWGHDYVYNLAVGGIQNPFGATLTLEDSTVARNTASVTADNWDGDFRVALAIGGVDDGGTATLNDSTVKRNSATASRTADARWVGTSAYGGIQSFGPGALRLNRSSVSRNSATAIAEGDGAFAIAIGGITNFDGAMSLTDIKVTSNTAIAEASEGSAGYAAGGVVNEFTNFFGSLVTLTDSVVSGNRASATFAAGGIEVYQGDMTVENTVVARNEAASDFWAVGGVDNGFGSMFTLTGGKVTENTADGPGVDGVRVGGINSDPDFIDIVGTTIRKNVPTNCSFPDDACPT